jgi:hypothetical protein
VIGVLNGCWPDIGLGSLDFGYAYSTRMLGGCWVFRPGSMLIDKCSKSRLAGRRPQRRLDNVTDFFGAGVLAETTARHPWMSGRQRRQGRQTTTSHNFFHQLITPPRSLGPLSPTFKARGVESEAALLTIVEGGIAARPARLAQSAYAQPFRDASARQFWVDCTSGLSECCR